MVIWYHFLLIAISCLPATTGSLEERYDVRCNDMSYVMVWERELWKNADNDNIDIALLDPQCNTYGSNATHVWMERQLDECGSVTTTTSQTITFKNMASVKVKHKVRTVVREDLHTYTALCTMARSKYPGSARMDVRKEPVVVVINDTSDSSSQPLVVHMALKIYKDEKFNELSPIPLKVRATDHIHVEAARTNIGTGNQTEYDVGYTFIVNTCYKSKQPTVDAGADLDYILFNKCPLVAPFDIFKDVNNNKYYRFVVYTETLMPWIVVQKEVYFHCQIDICKVNSTSPQCSPSCNPAASITGANSANDDKPLKRITLSTSRVEFQEEAIKPTCADKTCYLNSTCEELTVPTCFCDDGFAFSRNLSKCVYIEQEKKVVVSDLKVDQPWEEEYANTSSQAFKEKAQEYEEAVFRLIKATNHDDKIEAVKVTKITQGSLIFEFVIIRSAAATENDAQDAFKESILGQRAKRSSNSSSNGTDTEEQSTSSDVVDPLDLLRKHYKFLSDEPVLVATTTQAPEVIEPYEGLSWYVPLVIVLGLLLVLAILLITLTAVRRHLSAPTRGSWNIGDRHDIMTS